jgi:hypothetical protein
MYLSGSVQVMHIGRRSVHVVDAWGTSREDSRFCRSPPPNIPVVRQKFELRRNFAAQRRGDYTTATPSYNEDRKYVLLAHRSFTHTHSSYRAKVEARTRAVTQQDRESLSSKAAQGEEAS